MDPESDQFAPDRLTHRSESELFHLSRSAAIDLTFNELVALAGQRLAVLKINADYMQQRAEGEVEKLKAIDAGRDVSLAHTALEDALTRYNSACYRVAGSWKRADPGGP